MPDNDLMYLLNVCRLLKGTLVSFKSELASDCSLSTQVITVEVEEPQLQVFNCKKSYGCLFTFESGCICTQHSFTGNLLVKITFHPLMSN